LGKSTNKILVAPARSGSTWVCSLLNELPNTVALDEPYARSDIKGLSIAGFIDIVEKSFATQRQMILKRKQAISTRLINGGLGNHYGNADSRGIRKRQVEIGTIDVNKILCPDFNLIVKHTLPFTATIRELMKKFPTYVLLRNPLAILISWNSIDAAYREGRIQPYAAALTGDLPKRLTSSDRLQRQVNLLEWHFEQYLHVDPGRLIRYEDVLASKIEPFRNITGETAGAQASLSIAPQSVEKLFETIMKRSNSSPLFAFYDRRSVDILHNKLLKESTLRVREPA
jgi:hypothetical protein